MFNSHVYFITYSCLGFQILSPPQMKANTKDLQRNIERHPLEGVSGVSLYTFTCTFGVRFVHFACIQVKLSDISC